jgi:S1-C subfamily serine protease
MKKVLTTSVIALMLCALGISQTKRTPKSKVPASSTSLTAREIARRSLPSVVVLISRDTNGEAVTLGSGFFVTPRIIATNYHVISEASRATAKLLTGDRSEYGIDGTVAIDEDHDLALLQIGAGIGTGDDPYLVPLGRPLRVAGGMQSEIGDTVYVAGNPEGFEGTFSPGIVSGFRGADYIQITAPISPGSSGGPVMNDHGEVIGIATLSIREGQNLNFAIPVSRLISLIGKVTNAKPLAPRPSKDLPSPPTPRPQARTESLVSASDTLFVREYRKESRKYRFHLTESAHVKGRFSTQGGNLWVEIFSEGRVIYSSGNISSDSIEKTLPSGTYEVVVSLIDNGVVGFSINLTAFYDH